MSKALVADLHPFPGNPRRGDVPTIVASLERLGQYRPIVVNAGTLTGRPNEVLAGNHTLLAARELGWVEIDIHLVDVDEDDARRIVVVDNRANDKATYDDTDLVAILQALPDLDDTGWTPDEFEALLAGVRPEPDNEVGDEADAAPALPREAVTQPGDVWRLGDSVLVCGDATDPLVWDALFDGTDAVADAMWTDPPYGVEYTGGTAEGLTIQNDTAAGLRDLLDGAFGGARERLRPGAPWYIAHADRQRLTFEHAAREAGFLVRQTLIWVKNAMVLGHSDYHYRHEPILYGFTGGYEGRLGRGGPGWWGNNAQVSVFEVPKPQVSADHPTMKPVALILGMLTNSVKPHGVVLDPFAGSGSTLIAALHRHCTARLIELEPRYCDVICARYQMFTGQQPVRDGVAVDFPAQPVVAA